MKTKRLIVATLAVLTAAYFLIAGRAPAVPGLEMLSTQAGAPVAGQSAQIAGFQTRALSDEKSAVNDRVSEGLSAPARAQGQGQVQEIQVTASVAGDLSGSSNMTPRKGSDTLAPSRAVSDPGPSIGTVRVLGHRGCDVNTVGWFLSVGTPEQYDFKVSDDGESLEVTPDVSKPTGGFEFVHCADASQLVGHRVRFSAQVRAQAAVDIAQLRLRGENVRREKILYDDIKVGGTHGWKDYFLESEVGPDVTLFSYGLTFNGMGKLWLSHPRFEILE